MAAMDSLITYDMSENIIYCPVAFNNKILGEVSFQSSSNSKVEEDTLFNILDKISGDRNMYILDCMSNIYKLTFSEQNNGQLTANKNIAFYCEEKFYNKCLKKHGYCLIRDYKGCLAYSRMSKRIFQDFIEEKLRNKDDIIKTVYAYIYIRFFMKEIKANQHAYEFGNLKYLESSNIYVNRYINIKALFSQPQYVKLTINKLIQQIQTGFSDSYKKACLLGVSNNGIILSRLLAYSMQLEARSINHIGPRYSFDSDSEFLKDFKDKKFILVSDVICLGGEYRMAKGILNALGAKLLGAVCIVMIYNVYRDSLRKMENSDSIYAIVEDINSYQIEGETIDYHIFIDEEG